MKLFIASHIKEIDAFTIENEPISSIQLIERVAECLYQNITNLCKPYQNIAIIAGNGNNGSDAFALALLMKKSGFQCSVFSQHNESMNDANRYFSKKIESVKPLQSFLSEISFDIIIDGLFGTGLSRPVDGLSAEVIQHINLLNTTVISIDIPSGMYADITVSNNTNIVKATYTLTIEFPKLSFMLPENDDYLGTTIIVNVGLNKTIQEQISSPFYLVTESDISINKRKSFSHKGTFGHTAVIAGSKGKMGACLLATRAALKSGSGLVTTIIPQCGIDIIQIAIPEAMAITSSHYDYISNLPDVSFANSVCLGPGLGTSVDTQKAILEYIKTSKTALVIDADALNCIAMHNSVESIPRNSIITPHPKEFDRLFGTSTHFAQRINTQIQYAQKLGIYIILKGHRTSIATPEGRVYFNSTGNPAMATAGSGDVLSGIISAFLAQGYNPFQSAINAVYLHGLAGDIAAQDLSEHCVNASDIIACIPRAFLKITEIKQ